MKLFQTGQKYFENMGIDSRQLRKNHPHFNTKNVLASCIFCLDVISATVFLLYEAHTFYDYADSVYSTSCAENSCVIFMIIFWKMPKFFKFIKKFENLVESSKFVMTKFEIVFNLSLVVSFCGFALFLCRIKK